jgi:hypothetical protein
MKMVSKRVAGAFVGLALLLTGCATGGVSQADLYGPNFGVRVLPHFDADHDPDPVAITNGLYSGRPLNPCERCSPQSALTWSGWTP